MSIYRFKPEPGLHVHSMRRLYYEIEQCLRAIEHMYASSPDVMDEYYGKVTKNDNLYDIMLLIVGMYLMELRRSGDLSDQVRGALTGINDGMLQNKLAVQIVRKAFDIAHTYRSKHYVKQFILGIFFAPPLLLIHFVLEGIARLYVLFANRLPWRGVYMVITWLPRMWYRLGEFVLRVKSDA